MVAMTPDKWKRLRWAAIKSGFGFLVFVIALYFSFPYERAKEVAIRQAAAKDLDVEIGSAGFAFGLGVAFHDIRVRTRPTTGKPTRFTIEKAKVSFSPWSLLPGAAKEYAIGLDAFGGKIDIDQVGAPGKKTKFSTLVQARDVNMAELPGVKEAINLPLGGTLRLDFNVKSDTGKYADASGDIAFTVSDCVLGDGKTPLKVSGNAFLSAGLTLPRTRLGDLVGHVAIQKGVAKLQGVEAKSPDVELSLEGDVTLRDPLPMSTVNAYLRFKFSDAFLQKAPAVQTMLQLAGAQGKRADGAYGMRLGGRLGQLTSALSATSPVTGGAPTPRPVTRPSISPSSTLPAAVPPSAPPPQPLPPPPAAEPPPPPPPPSPPPAVEATPPAATPPGAPQGPPGSGWRGTPAGAPPGPAGATDGPVAAAPAPAPAPTAAAPTPEAAPAAPPAAETPPAPAPAPSE